MQDSGHDRAQRVQRAQKNRNNANDLRAFLRFPGATAPLQATKAKIQRSRNSYAGFRPRQSPARPKPRYNVKSRRRSNCSYFEDIGPSSFLHHP